MASKEVVKSMLKLFCDLWEKKITPGMQDAYSNTLKGCTDEEIKKAGYQCMETCQYFPKPAEILCKIHITQTKKQYGAKFNQSSGYCQVCKKTGCMTMQDDEDNNIWKCRECYTGLTNEQIQQKFKDLYNILDDVKEMP